MARYEKIAELPCQHDGRRCDANATHIVFGENPAGVVNYGAYCWRHMLIKLEAVEREEVARRYV